MILTGVSLCGCLHSWTSSYLPQDYSRCKYF